ncbi:hypothetical protein [Parachitinimonas caeni]|uniref:Uncharacterized protein n=1 Tax=Parachitinimonas caeni TaxID=3031301 RepID=A0ABT7DWY8_9NEIS|nr:hypothetical protein [Parachitinimonas caeni]MDK2124499.1 hypothetical protein [Parachitinimonas caeni]
MSNFRLFHDLPTRHYHQLSSMPPAVPTLPLDNLLSPGRDSRTRWLSTSVTVQFAWDSGRVIDSVAAIRGNWSAAATWQLKLWRDADRSLLVYDSGSQSVYPRLGWGEFAWGIAPIGASVYDGWPLKFGVMQFPPLGAVAGELRFDDPGNPAGYLEMARLLIGLSYSPSHNADSPQVYWLDDAKQVRTAGGSLVTVSAVEPYRRGELSYSSLPETDRAALTELARQLGGREDWFGLVWDGAKESRLLMHGAIHAKFVQPPKAIHRARDAFDIPTFSFEEC